MISTETRNLLASTLRAVAAVAVVTTIGSCWGDPPVVIKRAGPLRFDSMDMRGEPVLPDDERIQFAIECAVDGAIMTDDWKVIGKVSSVDHSAGRLEFQTNAFYVRGKLRENSRAGQMAFRLPHNLKLPLSVGDSITILHDHSVHGKKTEWDIHIASGDQLILATSHAHDDAPPRSADRAEVLFAGAPGGHSVLYWSDPADDDVDQDLIKAVPVHAPISLKTRDDGTQNVVRIDGDTIVDVELDDHRFKFILLASEHYWDRDEIAAQESPSHRLECLLIRAEPIARR